jgi:hypothetical protein
MTETPQASTESTTGTAGSQRPSRLTQAAAAVGIVAGVVFIVGVVFFSGFFLGSHSAHSGPQVMRCEMGGSGEGKGGMGPGGMGPGGMGPMGPMGPSQPPSSTSTAPPVPSTPRP